MALIVGGVAVDATAAEIDVLDGLARGSIIYGNASGVTTALAAGSDNHVLTVDGSDINWEAAAGDGDSWGGRKFCVSTSSSFSATTRDFTITFPLTNNSTWTGMFVTLQWHGVYPSNTAKFSSGKVAYMFGNRQNSTSIINTNTQTIWADSNNLTCSHSVNSTNYSNQVGTIVMRMSMNDGNNSVYMCRAEAYGGITSITA